MPAKTTWTGSERRTRDPKPRKLNERRQDMLILSSATYADIYLWALSLVIMGIILGGFIILAIVEMNYA